MKISIIGLGYVGLPLAIALNKHFDLVCYDKSIKRVNELKTGFDRNFEFSKKEIKKINEKKFSHRYQDLYNSDVYIITVPTPIFKSKIPDLRFLKSACKIVGKVIKNKSIIVFESTVFPGCTEEICGPMIEKFSKKKMNKDFFLAYSPERINVGDKKNTIENITKLVGASNKKTLDIVSNIYSKIIKAGVYKCESIKVAESAKAIENAQRDINIAFINEIGKIFSRLNISLNSVLNAASTKWNFLNFKPGLVGGHCIGVDPYYLTYISRKIGIKPKVIDSGRSINDKMHETLGKIFLNKISAKKKKLNILILGLSFKENTNDIRNSKIFDLCKYLKKKKHLLTVFDPLIEERINDNNFIFTNKIFFRKKFDAIFFAVPHKKIISNIDKIISYLKENGVIFDLKNILNSKNISKNNFNIIKF